MAGKADTQVSFQVPLNPSELKRLSDVIMELEKKTTGEIRLMIVGRSILTSHIFYVLFGGLTGVVFLTMWIERHRLIWLADPWLVPVVLVGAAIFAWVMGRIPWVIRVLTGARDLQDQVLKRAEVEFYREGLNGTTSGTGILLFMSLLEHQAVVLADKGIASRLNPDVWNGVVAQMVTGARTGKWSENLEAALRQCGTLLAEHFPAQSVNPNELPNHVILKD